MTDFYQTVHKVSRVIEKEYKADGLNVAIQDGPWAGQTVPHVHCHIIPRRKLDFTNSKGEPIEDEVYGLLEGEKGDLMTAFEKVREVVKKNVKEGKGMRPEETRTGPRSGEVMETEAARLSKLFEQTEL